MVILHDAIKTIQNSVFFLKKEQKPVSLKKNKKNGLKKQQKTRELFLTRFFTPRLPFNPFLWFSFDRTIWSKSRHYQFDWVCAAHLKCRSLLGTEFAEKLLGGQT